MNRARLALATILALLLGVSVLASPAAAGDGNRRQRPIRINLELTFEIGGESDCDVEAGFLSTVLDGGGRVSNLGRVKLEGGGCANFTPGSADVGQLDGGFVRYTTVSGAVLDLLFTGALDVDFAAGTFVGGGTLLIDGGSGRFRSAVGEIDWSIDGALSATGGSGTIVGDGWIAFDRGGGRR